MSITNLRKGYVDTRHGQVHYRTCGAGPALVLLHQTASASEMYAALMPLLPGRVIALDTPGFGQSFTPAEPLTIPWCAAVLGEALAGLEVTVCDLFGHHTGAAIAVALAHADPGRVRRLIVSGPPLLSTEQKAMLQAGLRPFSLEPDGQHLTRVWERLRRRDPELPLRVVHREALLTLAAVECAEQAYQAVFAQDFAGQLAALRQPILLLAGDHDTLRASLEPAAALVPHAEVHVLPGATSYVCDRQPEALAAVIKAFLAPAGEADGARR